MELTTEHSDGTHGHSVMAPMLAAVAGSLVLATLIITARSVITLREGSRMLDAGDHVAAVAALDATLQAAPQWLVPVRRRAIRELTTLADGNDATTAWYASLALVSASPPDQRERWQRRCHELVGGLGAPPDPWFPMEARAGPSGWSTVSMLSLLGAIVFAVSALARPTPPARRRLLLAAAAVFWLLWLATLPVS